MVVKVEDSEAVLERIDRAGLLYGCLVWSSLKHSLSVKKGLGLSEGSWFFSCCPYSLEECVRKGQFSDLRA